MLRITRRDSTRRFRALLISFFGLLLCTLSACNDPLTERDRHVQEAEKFLGAAYYGAALNEIEAALAISPDHAQSLHLLDKALQRGDRWPRLLHALLQAHQLGLKDTELQLRLLQSLYENQYWEKALRYAATISRDQLSPKQLSEITYHEAIISTALHKTNEAAQKIRSLETQNLPPDLHDFRDDLLISLKLNQLEQRFPFRPSHRMDVLPGAKYWNNDVVDHALDLKQESDAIRDQVLRIYSNNDETRDFALARLALIEDEPESAIKLLTQLLTHHPDHQAAQGLLARSHFLAGHLNAAEQLLLKQTELDRSPQAQRNDANLYFTLLQLKGDQGEMDNVLIKIGAQAEQMPLDEDSLLHLIQADLNTARNTPTVTSALRYKMQQALKRFPHSAYVYAQAAMVHLHYKQVDKAIKAFQEARYLASSDPRFTQALFELFLQTGRLNEARSVAETLKTHFSDHAVTEHNLARLALRENKSELAESLWQDMIVSYPDFYASHIQLASLYRQQGETDRAKDLLDQALRHAPTDAGLNIERAILDDYSGRFSDAKFRLETVKLRDAKNWQAELALGYLALRAGQINQALEHLNKLETHAAHLPAVTLFHARVMQVLDNPVLALADYESLLTQQTGNPEFMLGAAQVEIKLGQLQQAAFRLDQLTSNSPRFTTAYVNTLMDLRVQQGRMEDVEDAIKILIKQDKNRTQANTMFADLLMRKGDYATALKHYQKALFSDPDPAILIKQTEALDALNRRGDAISLIKQKQAQQQDITKLKIRLIDLFLSEGDENAAVNALTNLLDEQPDQLFALTRLANIYYRRGVHETNPRQGNLATAWQYAKRAYAITEVMPEVLSIYGELCILRGRVDEGLHVLERAVAYSPNQGDYLTRLVSAYEKVGRKRKAESWQEIHERALPQQPTQGNLVGLP